MSYYGAYFGSTGSVAASPIADGPTTFELIRNAQATVIEAFAPTLLSGRPFRRHREKLEFMAWVTANPKACLRRFQILSGLDIEASPSSDGTIELWRHTEDIRVAYPTFLGIYGAENDRDMEDVMELDIRQIDGGIGRHGLANYVAGQQLCERQTTDVINVEGARVLSMTYLVQYDRSV